MFFVGVLCMGGKYLFNFLYNYHQLFLSYIQIQMSSAPNSTKTVSIKLQSPNHKAKKQQSPSNKKQSFNQPISKLKKTFKDGNVYDHIKHDHERRINQNKNEQRRRLRLQQEQDADNKFNKSITANELEVCQEVYNKLDKERKDYTIMSDLKNLNNDQLIKIVKVIYFRKQENSLFDLIYGLWDTDSLGRLMYFYNKKQ